MPPEVLQQQQVPMVDPETLFRGVTIRPSSPLPTPEQMKTPDSLFGDQRLAEPGHSLKSPQELDLLPGQPLPEIQLEPLDSFFSPEAQREDGESTHGLSEGAASEKPQAPPQQPSAGETP